MLKAYLYMTKITLYSVKCTICFALIEIIDRNHFRTEKDFNFASFLVILPFINYKFYFYFYLPTEFGDKCANEVRKYIVYVCYALQEKKCLIYFLRKHVCALIAWERICSQNKIKTKPKPKQESPCKKKKVFSWATFLK